MQICPSILENTASDYLNVIKKLSSYYQYFQIDLSDGIYVENKTAGVDDLIKEFYSNEFKILLNSKNLTFDFHLMVKDYKSYIQKINRLNEIIKIKNIFIHFNLLPNYTELNTLFPFAIGLVLNPGDQIESLSNKYRLIEIPCLQIMTVEPGAQGRPFIENALNKVEQLRNIGYRNKIYLDGSINDKTLPIICSKKYMPDVLCPGSYLAKSVESELTNRVNYLLSFK